MRAPSCVWAPLGRSLLVCAALLCAPGGTAAQNVVLVIADDVGAEWFSAYGEQSGNPPTPTIDSLAANGVLFRNAWAYPVCSPFRISAYTGRHPGEHGAGHAVDGNTDALDYVLAPNLPSLASILRTVRFRTAAVGKWHMAHERGFTGANYLDGILSGTELHPNLTGMDHFSGHLFGGLIYTSWWKTVNGVSSTTTHYATSDTADAAIARLAGPGPFFLWVAFNAPHAPFHQPPAHLLANPSLYGNNDLDRYRAMIEAMDTELGRILQHVDFSDTTVIFVADNGTYAGFLLPPRPITGGKATVYETGVRVPLIVAGRGVAAAARGRESHALVQATDLFPTVLELAGVAPPPRRDAISMVPYLSDPGARSRRRTAYTELFTPNGGPIDPQTHDRAARGPRYKLVRRGTRPDELYDLALDPYERFPVSLSALTPEQSRAYTTLAAAIRAREVSPSVPALPAGAVAGLAVVFAGIARRALGRCPR